MIRALSLLLLLTAPAFAQDIPAQYDHPFAGRLIVETLSYWAVRERCKDSWDVRPGQWAVACSWRFPDPLNPGRMACHVVYPRLEDGAWSVDDEVLAIRTETANCNGWHAKQVAYFAPRTGNPNADNRGWDWGLSYNSGGDTRQ